MITFWEFMKAMDEELNLRPAKYKPGAVVPPVGPKAGGAGLNPFKVVKPQKIQPYRPYSSTKKKPSSIVGEK